MLTVVELRMDIDEPPVGAVCHGKPGTTCASVQDAVRYEAGRGGGCELV